MVCNKFYFFNFSSWSESSYNLKLGLLIELIELTFKSGLITIITMRSEQHQIISNLKLKNEIRQRLRAISSHAIAQNTTLKICLES
jgi:hypothetical protein